MICKFIEESKGPTITIRIT